MSEPKTGEADKQTGAVASGRSLPGWARPGLVMLGAAGAPGLAFISSLPVWVRAEVSTVLDSTTLEISGADAASTVSALALVALVAAVALRLAGPALRKVLAVLIAVAGGGLALAAFGVQANPQAAVMSFVSAASGTNAPADSYEVTVFPWLACAAGVLVALSGIWALVASGFWPARRQKYDRSAARAKRLEADGENPDEIDAWDSLSEGKDPTDR